MNALGGSGLRIQRAARVAADHAMAVDREGRFPAEAIAALREDGLLGAMIPAALGGEGQSLTAVASCCNTLARGCASAAMIYAMHQIQVACLVRHALHADWHRDFAARLVREQLLLSSGTSEIGIGGDLRASICAMQIADGRFVLEKRSPVMSYGAHADGALVSARRGPESPRSDQVFVTVLRDETVLTRTGTWDGLGLRGSCSEAFDMRATGSAEQVFPTPFADIATDTMLPVSHLLWAALWLGMAGDAVERARAFLRAQARRNPGAVPPGAARLASAVSLLQMVQDRLRAALARFETTREGGALADDADLNALKLGGSQMCLQAVQEALQICGMAGYRNDGEYSVARHLRDMWSAPLMVGNDRVAANTGAMLLAQRAPVGAI